MGACFNAKIGRFILKEGVSLCVGVWVCARVCACAYVCVCVCLRVCVGHAENDRVKKQTGWLRCPQLQPIGSPKMHHSCPPANPSLPCGAGVSLEDCYLAKCSQANDAGSWGWSEMWSLKAENFVEPFIIPGGQVFLFIYLFLKKAATHSLRHIKTWGEDKQKPTKWLIFLLNRWRFFFCFLFFFF